MSQKLKLDVQKLIELYNEGFSTIKIAEKFNTSYPTIVARLKESGIKIRNLRDSHLKKIFNENYFEKIDSEDKAYWLGFLYADGNIRINIHKRGYKSYITSFTQVEEEPLLKFKRAISGENIRITQYKYKDEKIAYSLHLNSKPMFDNLNKQGCIPNKSLVLKFPDNLPENLNNHFIRGYFDGDGSIFTRNIKSNYKNHTAIYKNGGFSLMGTCELLTKIKEILNFVPSSMSKEKRRGSNTWELRITGMKSIEKLYNYLYENSSTCILLERKKSKFEQVIREKGSTTIIGSPIKTPVYWAKNRIKG